MKRVLAPGRRLAVLELAWSNLTAAASRNGAAAGAARPAARRRGPAPTPRSLSRSGEHVDAVVVVVVGVAEQHHFDRAELLVLLQLRDLLDAALAPRIEHQDAVAVLRHQDVGVAGDPQVLRHLRPRLLAVARPAPSARKSYFGASLEPLLGEALEALEEADLLDRLRGVCRAPSAMSFVDDRAVGGQQVRRRSASPACAATRRSGFRPASVQWSQSVVYGDHSLPARGEGVAAEEVARALHVARGPHEEGEVVAASGPASRPA